MTDLIWRTSSRKGTSRAPHYTLSLTPYLLRNYQRRGEQTTYLIPLQLSWTKDAWQPTVGDSRIQCHCSLRRRSSDSESSRCYQYINLRRFYIENNSFLLGVDIHIDVWRTYPYSRQTPFKWDTAIWPMRFSILYPIKRESSTPFTRLGISY